MHIVYLQIDSVKATLKQQYGFWLNEANVANYAIDIVYSKTDKQSISEVSRRSGQVGVGSCSSGLIMFVCSIFLHLESVKWHLDMF